MTVAEKLNVMEECREANARRDRAFAGHDKYRRTYLVEYIAGRDGALGNGKFTVKTLDIAEAVRWATSDLSERADLEGWDTFSIVSISKMDSKPADGTT